MSRLFEIEITLKAVVCAENEAGAWRAARDSAREIVSDDPLNAIDVVREVRSATELPEPWDGKCFPYGDNGNKNIDDHLAELPPERDTATADMFAGAASAAHSAEGE